jgi:transcriptional regulator with XRE-family HTH domain
MKESPVAAQSRRREFGAFLRSRRERLTPASVGLPEGTRRRTPGLRREEVALLAGVGATWYTWLEQGRDVRASSEVLGGLALALRLDETERQHLFALDGHTLPHRSTGPEIVPESLHRMLASLTSQPALVLGRRWDVLLWNRAAGVLFGNYEGLEGDARNIMHNLFANERHRRLLVDWEPLARASLAMFRADCARYAGDLDFERLIALLKKASPEFRRWWPKHEVRAPVAGNKRIQHPRAGRMVFEHTTFAAMGPGDLRLVLYTPLAEAQTIEKLDRLLRGADTAKRAAA